MSVSYKEAGVDLEAAEASTKRIAGLARSTFNEQVLHDVGLFAGFYALDLTVYHDPVLVSSIDGVGTKLKIAFAMGRHSSVGMDLVNHCVNDIMTSGADPLFFLDYLGTGALDPDIAEEVVSGMAAACRENGCALIGGETAEMPGFYRQGEYDLAGAIFGAVNRDDIIDGRAVRAGDRLIGCLSHGLHTNGYSLARRVLMEQAAVNLKENVPELGASWGETLLKVHKSYAKAITSVRFHKGVTGISHITGGGIEGNTRRLLKKGLTLNVDWSAWEAPAEFRLIQQAGGITDHEMRRVFNMGIGLVFIVHEEAVCEIAGILRGISETAVDIGRVVPS